MTNREFYKEQILNIVCDGAAFAVSKTDNTICRCNDLECENCEFHDAKSCNCNRALRQWCNAEHTEPCEFELDELVEVSDNEINWSLRHFSQKLDNLYYCFVNGYDSTDNKYGHAWNFCRKYGTLGGLVKEE